MNKPLVTILVPNYRTKVLTQLCLRLIRYWTDAQLYKVIVIDNDSADDSLAYLKTVAWIHLIERQASPGESAPLSHSRALDQALALVDTPYVLSIHTDTLIKQAAWLPFLLQQIEGQPQVAGVGSWKLEHKSIWKRCLKRLEFIWQYSRLKANPGQDHALEGVGANHYYLRSHCALYRTELLQRHGLTFSLNDEVAGKAMHRRLIELGYHMTFLSSDALLPYLDHINHATMILNPELGARSKTVAQGLKKIAQRLRQVDLQGILNDSRLDQ